MLYIIGIGLNDEKDISVKGLEAVKKCEKIYLEAYTSKLQVPIEKLEEYYGKKIIKSERELVENAEEILNNAKKENTALLIIGDVFSATTHYEIYNEAKKQNIETEIIFNASVLTAISITGLQLHKFGKTASIPFHNENVEAPIKVLKENQSIGLHTLFLLDLTPKENKYLKISDAIEYLNRGAAITEKTTLIACARLGSKDFKIKAGTLKQLKKEDFGLPPYCLIIPGKLHFAEEEAIETWK